MIELWPESWLGQRDEGQSRVAELRPAGEGADGLFTQPVVSAF